MLALFQLSLARLKDLVVYKPLNGGKREEPILGKQKEKIIVE
jgi:hypothetical protein